MVKEKELKKRLDLTQLPPITQSQPHSPTKTHSPKTPPAKVCVCVSVHVWGGRGGNVTDIKSQVVCVHVCDVIFHSLRMGSPTGSVSPRLPTHPQKRGTNMACFSCSAQTTPLLGRRGRREKAREERRAE